MSNKLFSLFLFACMFQAMVPSIYNVNDSNKNTIERKIELQSMLATGKLRSTLLPYDVVLRDHNLDITYLNDLSGIHIELHNELRERTFQVVANPVNGNHLLINLSESSEGYYTICFKNRAGEIIYGEFEWRL